MNKSSDWRASIVGLMVGVLSMISTQSIAETPFSQAHSQGWYWGEDFSFHKKSKAKKPKQKMQVEASKSSVQSQIEALQKELETSTQQAYLSIYNQEPVEVQLAHMEKMLATQMRHLNVSEQFSKIGRLATIKNAYLDEQVRNPYLPEARKIKNSELSEVASLAATELMQSHGLYFFFSSDCQYCHLMAPIVQRFAEKHQAVVIPVSVNGGSLPQFQNPGIDQGLSAKYQVEYLPTLIAVNPKTGQSFKLANRPTSIAELEETTLLYSQLLNQRKV